MKPVETPAALSQETVDHIKDLVRINNDSSKGFADAADVVEDPELKKLFSDMSEQRKRFAGELGHYVAVNDNDESMLSIDNLSGTWKGTLHRWWQDLRGKLSGGDAYAVLAEAERCEDRIKACYEQTIKKPRAARSATCCTSSTPRSRRATTASATCATPPKPVINQATRKLSLQQNRPSKRAACCLTSEKLVNLRPQLFAFDHGRPAGWRLLRSQLVA